MEFSSEVRYQDTHEWARKEDGEVVVGISDYAQSTLSDVVYVELPEVGEQVSKGNQVGVVESVKAAGDIYAPVSGEVVAVNDALEDAPEIVNQDPTSGIACWTWTRTRRLSKKKTLARHDAKRVEPAQPAGSTYHGR